MGQNPYQVVGFPKKLPVKSVLTQNHVFPFAAWALADLPETDDFREFRRYRGGSQLGGPCSEMACFVSRFFLGRLESGFRIWLLGKIKSLFMLGWDPFGHLESFCGSLKQLLCCFPSISKFVHWALPYIGGLKTRVSAGCSSLFLFRSNRFSSCTFRAPRKAPA